MLTTEWDLSFLSDLAPYLCFSGANIVKFSEYNQYNYQSSKSFPHKSISDGAFHKLHPTNSPIANKKIKYIIIVRFVSMSYNNTVNWIKVHSTQNCCFSYVYFQCRECIIWFSCTKTSNFVHDNDQFRSKLSHLLNNYAFRV